MELLEKATHRIFSRIVDLVDLRRLTGEVLRGDQGVVVAGLGGTSRALFLASLRQAFQRPMVVITPHDRSVESLANDIGYFYAELSGKPADRVCPFPAWDVDPYTGLSPHADIQRARATTLWRLRHHRADIVVTSTRALAGRLCSPAEFETFSLHISVGDELSQELLAEHLNAAGYLRQEPVSSTGEFSIRGGIVDVFSPLMKHPVRIEFFGDDVDSIREFDLDDQRSRSPIPHVDILPMREVILGREMLRQWALRGRERWTDEIFQRDLNEKLVFADNGESFPGATFLISVLRRLDATPLDYLAQPILVLDEPEVLDANHVKWFATLEHRFDQTHKAGGLALAPGELFLSPEALCRAFAGHHRLSLEEVGAAAPGFFMAGQPARKFHGRIKEMVEAVRDSYQAGRQVVLVGTTIGMAERLRDILHEYGLPFRVEFGEPPPKFTEESSVPIIAVGNLTGGFRLGAASLEVYAESDIFDEIEHLPPPGRRRKTISSFISDFQDLKPGDYVVHVDHGIGIYDGLATVHDKECMLITYLGGDRLYVPLERLDLVQKYSAAEGAKPPLDKLGGGTWIARQTRVKRALRDLAQELLRLYAERKLVQGYSFGPDTGWQKEFEEAFLYEETADQLTTIQDIKRDMEAPQPMDRLVCGDVGYGKTEVAMRAAFKAVNDGKQVAVLAPTTVLCYQHYETFKERFAAFPVRVAMLSRFVAPREQKKILGEAEAGKVDILVGTHRLLSKDVQLRDVGLVVVDEEQRFGVAHKERLKQLKKQVDVLTLTATPIPRTLQMALGGLRDMSIIETPPRDRLAIQTAVVKFNATVIQNAIDFEIDRGGQVYFVHNRVESIYSLANFAQKICARARIGVAHGQMGERELERIMARFMRHEFDVLVSTTIIENGLDIALANTLIVNRADRFGLAQLYQLRGRVGRSNRRAYAYLLIPSDDALTPVARRRLAAIREFSELGSGFRIAALDLELRGAGNLLGAEQHGHIEAVGFDLYCQMLERTMDEMRNGEAPPEVETAISLKVDLKIPPDFIDDEVQRLRIYKQIASARTESEIDQQYRDLEDRLGELPVSVRNLLEYARLRVIGRSLGVMAIERGLHGVDIKFHEGSKIDPDRIVQLVGGNLGVRFAPPATLRIKPGRSRSDLFESIVGVLRELS